MSTLCTSTSPALCRKQGAGIRVHHSSARRAPSLIDFIPAQPRSGLCLLPICSRCSCTSPARVAPRTDSSNLGVLSVRVCQPTAPNAAWPQAEIYFPSIGVTQAGFGRSVLATRAVYCSFSRCCCRLRAFSLVLAMQRPSCCARPSVTTHEGPHHVLSSAFNRLCSTFWGVCESGCACVKCSSHPQRAAGNINMMNGLT